MSGFEWEWPVSGNQSSEDTSSESTSESESEKGAGDDEPAEWVVVLTTFEMPQAIMAATRLSDEGVVVRLRQEAVSTALPVTLGILGRIDVLVPAPQEDRAAVILTDLGFYE